MRAAVLVVILVTAACSPRAHRRLEGRTMGTTWAVTVVASAANPEAGLQEAIDLRLEALNRQLSTWIVDSDISRFNRLAGVGEEFPVSPDFLEVMTAAEKIFALSDGAWDGTVGPLVALWGFGPEGPALASPSPASLVAALATVGFERIEVRPGGVLVKRDPGVTLDLSSIAKGLGVDVVAEVVRSRGYDDFLVEIGGEVVASGSRRDGRPWRVGINRPEPGAGPREVYRIVPLVDQALATSGDYRSYVMEGGVRRSHVIDPRTGQPVTNGVVSVSVLAPSCMLADGLATAVMVMGPDAGLELLEGLVGVEGFVLVEREGALLEERASSGFPPPTDPATRALPRTTN